jgi:GrpB-like predicted nucleotidyltransferase (UPF0157 family)
MSAENDKVVGLDHSSVKLSEFSHLWKGLYDEEAVAIRAALGDRVHDIEHIGSTAIVDMPAKPIIDIAATVGTDADLERSVQPLVDAGYDYKGEYGLPGRHFFIKGDPSTHHLHLVIDGSNHWYSWLLFRDYLVQHKGLADQYSEIKKLLAVQYADDRPAYTKAKGEFIVKALQQAFLDTIQ